MVEGPQCRLKAIKLQVLLNQCLRRLNIMHTTALQKASVARSVKRVEHQRVQKVFSVGKECFLTFVTEDDAESTHALRLHFGMSGNSVLFATGQTPPQLPQGSRKKQAALLEFTRHSILLYDSTVMVKTRAYVDQVVLFSSALYTLLKQYLSFALRLFSMQGVISLILLLICKKL